MGPARGHRPSRGGEQLASKLGKAEAAFKWPQETTSFSALRKSVPVWAKQTRAENLRLLLDALGSEAPTDFPSPLLSYLSVVE